MSIRSSRRRSTWNFHFSERAARALVSRVWDSYRTTPTYLAYILLYISPVPVDYTDRYRNCFHRAFESREK